jgi:hypothetical protein
LQTFSKEGSKSTPVITVGVRDFGVKDDGGDDTDDTEVFSSQIVKLALHIYIPQIKLHDYITIIH